MSDRKEIVEAVRSLRSKITRMAHDANNPHASYRYVSIDKYYEHVAKMITAEGLIWRVEETNYELIPHQGKNKDRTYAKVTFKYGLYKGSSSWEDYTRLTILSPVEGPQTTGSVVSYAEKVFMRTLATVPTGEDDADASAPEKDLQVVRSEGPDPLLDEDPTPDYDPETGEIPPKDFPIPDQQRELVSTFKDNLPVVGTKPIQTDKHVAMVEQIFTTFMPLVKSKQVLTDFHAENIAALEKVKTLDPAAHDRIKALFNNKFKELKGRK